MLKFQGNYSVLSVSFPTNLLFKKHIRAIGKCLWQRRKEWALQAEDGPEKLSRSESQPAGCKQRVISRLTLLGCRSLIGSSKESPWVGEGTAFLREQSCQAQDRLKEAISIILHEGFMGLQTWNFCLRQNEGSINTTHWSLSNNSQPYWTCTVCQVFCTVFMCLTSLNPHSIPMK